MNCQNDKTVISIVREYLEEAETKTARLQERVRELEEFVKNVGPCGLAISHGMGCPMMGEALTLLAKKE